MRRVPFVILVAAVLGAGLSGCWDGVPNPFAQKTPKPPAPVAAATPAAAPAPTPATAPAAEAAAAPAAAVTPVSSPAPAPEVVRWNPAQWPREEHRLAALIANAETRDTIGDTHRVVSDADARRQRCTTRACIQRVYAEEEAWLRQWEGSADVR
jgi:hypothetical protein